MRSAYRVLAYLVALEVIVQAAAIAFGVFGLFTWVDEGGVLDKAAFESGTINFTGLVGFIVHGINGQMIVPAIALVLLIVSFFARVPRGVQWAGIVVVAVAVQIFLGIFAQGTPGLGLLHGINALVVFTVAVVAARQAGVSTAVAGSSARSDTAGVG